MNEALTGVVFDTAAVAGWARRQPYPQAHVWSMSRLGGTVVIPAAVLATARAVVDDSDHDVLDILLELPQTLIPVLDVPTARSLTALLRRRVDQADALVSAAHAVAEARGRGWHVLTDRAEQLAALDPDLLFDSLP